MSVLEDTRRLLQDFQAPELRELSARIGALEARMDGKFLGLESGFDAAERFASERHVQILLAIGRLADVYELARELPASRLGRKSVSPSRS